MSYNYLRQPVLASELCFQRDADSFFSPVALKHTGFAADGLYYDTGVVSSTEASWKTEAPGTGRGILETFPTQVLVIVSRASVTLLDATTSALQLWMIFFFADFYGFSDNALGETVGYTPSQVTWNNGLLSIIMAADAGSTKKSPKVLTFDFVRDQIYSESHVAAI